MKESREHQVITAQLFTVAGHIQWQQKHFLRDQHFSESVSAL